MLAGTRASNLLLLVIVIRRYPSADKPRDTAGERSRVYTEKREVFRAKGRGGEIPLRYAAIGVCGKDFNREVERKNEGGGEREKRPARKDRVFTAL